MLSGNYLTTVYYIYLLNKALVLKTVKRLSKAVSLLLGSDNIANVDDSAVELADVVVFSANMLRTTVNTVESINNINRRLIVLVNSNRKHRSPSTKSIQLINKPAYSNCLLYSKSKLNVLSFCYRASNK